MDDGQDAGTHELFSFFLFRACAMVWYVLFP